LLKLLETAPQEQVAAAIEKMEEEINLLFEKASKAAAEMPAQKSVYQFW
jgi:hypothetical protein